MFERYAVFPAVLSGESRAEVREKQDSDSGPVWPLSHVSQKRQDEIDRGSTNGRRR